MYRFSNIVIFARKESRNCVLFILFSYQFLFNIYIYIHTCYINKCPQQTLLITNQNFAKYLYHDNNVFFFFCERKKKYNYCHNGAVFQSLCLLLKYLLIFENSIKTTVAYEFSKKHPRKNAYLDIANFVDDDPKKVLQQISILTKTIHDKVDRTGAIKHYIEEHGEVPLWVLVNFLTMGNIANFYNILTDSTKNIIAKFYTDKYRTQYKDNTFRLSSADLSACLKVANLVRNICAHDERLYNVNLRNVRISQIANHFGIRRYDNKRFIVVILFLKIVLDKKDFQRLYKALMNLFNQYADEFKTVVFDDILNTMGIDLTELEKLS